MLSQRRKPPFSEPTEAKKGVSTLKNEVAVVEGVYMETGVERMDSPNVHEPFRHLFTRNPGIVITVHRMLGGVGHVEEKEGVATMSKMRVELLLMQTVVPLYQLKLDGDIDEAILDFALSGGRLDAGELPHAVEQPIHRSLVAGDEEDRQQEERCQKEATGVIF